MSLAAVLKSYPMLKFSFAIREIEELNYKVENKNAFCILGKSCPLSRELEENFMSIPLGYPL